ncbi:unnamed protein product [Schistosoma margrebowiei]|uniref:Uncharacterized protein n=1 Tax=Schistosoma margrebowiei TaxID=48269 RepID=A0A183LZ55_9TREM|nr:unnamed protein product [Schistosoma margrebowiei]
MEKVFLISVIPESSTFFESDKQSGWNLESQWDVLHHLFKSVSFLVCLRTTVSKSSLLSELRKIMAQKSPKNEWKSALYEPNNKPFCMTHSFSLPVSELVVPLSMSSANTRGALTLVSTSQRFILFLNVISCRCYHRLSPDLWIMRIDAKHPVPTSIRIIYELVTKDGLLLFSLFKRITGINFH